MGLGSEVWCVWNLGAWDLKRFKVWLETGSLGLVGLGFGRFGCENIGFLNSNLYIETYRLLALNSGYRIEFGALGFVSKR